MADGRAPARAALAGNPSDGYGGAVLAVAVEAFAAEADVLDPEAKLRRASGEATRLVDAAVARFGRELQRGDGPRAVHVRTTIPRSVGLGGSSAIVIATLRALCAAEAATLDDVRMAELALSIEVEDLGIAGGLQDRVAQSFGGLTFMDFAASPPRYERLDPALLPPLLVAWRAETAADSGGVHGDLRARWTAGDPAVREGMRSLGEAARRARVAIRAGDRAGLRRAVDGSFEVRRTMMELDLRHVEMITCARGAGAAANYAGSGGAVVCVCDDEEHRAVVAGALRAMGCETVTASVDAG